MKSRRTAILNIALAGMFVTLGATGLAATAAAGVSKKQAMAVCRAQYGKDITDVVIRKNGQIVCQEGPAETASRQEVYEFCKRKLKATMIIMQKKGKRWHCLYSGNY